jgi:hypothetical protein
MKYVLSLAAFFAASVVYAQEDEQLFSRISERTLEKILDEERIPWERKEEVVKGKKLVNYTVTLDGFKVLLYTDGGSITLGAPGFRTRNKEDITLERANEWNASRRFAYASVSPFGDGRLHADLNIKGGTNKKIIHEFFQQYRASLIMFADFVR